NVSTQIKIFILSLHDALPIFNELIEQVYEGQIRQKDYEMKALQAQINPHFLYNSLSLINWKAIETGQEDISKITLALSSNIFLRSEEHTSKLHTRFNLLCRLL